MRGPGWWWMLLLGGFIGGATALAQQIDAEARARALRGNVVRVGAYGVRGDGSSFSESGFGFIVSAEGARLLIVTANHVVRGSRQPPPDQRIDRVTVTFFQDQGRTYPGTLLSLQDETYDLAVLEAPAPSSVRWSPVAMGSLADVKRGTVVSFIGRGQDWYVPTEPGRINEVALDQHVKVDRLDVAPGTSGAPLIGESGILGIIVTDAPGETRAVSIEVIRRAFAHWNRPWQLVAGRSGLKPLPPAGAPPPHEGGEAPPGSASASRRQLTYRELKVEIDEIRVISGEVEVTLAYTLSGGGWWDLALTDPAQTRLVDNNGGVWPYKSSAGLPILRRDSPTWFRVVGGSGRALAALTFSPPKQGTIPPADLFFRLSSEQIPRGDSAFVLVFRELTSSK